MAKTQYESQLLFWVVWTKLHIAWTALGLRSQNKDPLDFKCRCKFISTKKQWIQCPCGTAIGPSSIVSLTYICVFENMWTLQFTWVGVTPHEVDNSPWNNTFKGNANICFQHQTLCRPMPWWMRSDPFCRWSPASRALGARGGTACGLSCCIFSRAHMYSTLHGSVICKVCLFPGFLSPCT